MEEGKSRMVSDAELIGGISDYLRSADLKKTTVSIVRRKLEGDFGVDLSQRKPFIRQQVEFFLYNHVQEKSDDEPEEDEDEDCGSDSDENSDVSEHEESGGGGRPAVLEKKPDCRPSASKGSDVCEPLENGGDGGRPVVLEKKPDGRPSSGKASSRKLNKGANKLVIRSKSCVLSAQLQKFLGESKMLRFEVLNRLWEYVGQRKLIDPNDKEKILCDEKLKELFGIDSFKICQMNTHLSKHLSAAGSTAGAAPKPEEKKKPRKKKRAEAELNGAEKRPKRVVTTGILSPSPISETFINFLGTGEKALTRPGAIKRIWDYIKEHNLKKDPLNKRTILCDEKLKELFEVDTFDGFTVPKLIQAHFVKQT